MTSFLHVQYVYFVWKTKLKPVLVQTAGIWNWNWAILIQSFFSPSTLLFLYISIDMYFILGSMCEIIESSCNNAQGFNSLWSHLDQERAKEACQIFLD